MCNFTKALKKNFNIDQDPNSCNRACRYFDTTSKNNCFLEYMEANEHEHKLEEIAPKFNDCTKANISILLGQALESMRLKIKGTDSESFDFKLDNKNFSDAKVLIHQTAPRHLFNEDQTKRCTKCKIEKNICEFPSNHKSNDGLHCYCSECQRTYMRLKYLERKSLGKV